MKLTHSNYTDKEASAYKQLEDHDSLKWMEKIVASLPEQQKLIIQMREIEEMEFSTIGIVLDMNETAIRVALSRARKTIREEMLKTHGYGIG